MPLQPGNAAPDVRLISDSGEVVGLADLWGRQPVVVLFFPLAFTSTCTEELCRMGEDFSAYRELGAQVLAISVDSPYVLKRFKAECGVEFPFLSDFHREAAVGFDVLRAEPLGLGLRNTTERSVFVIDREGTVRYTWFSRNPSLLPPFEEVRAAVEGL